MSPPYICSFYFTSGICGSFLSLFLLLGNARRSMCQHAHTHRLLNFCLCGFERSVGGCRSFSLIILLLLRLRLLCFVFPSPFFARAVRLCLNNNGGKAQHFIRSYIQELANQTANQHYNLRCVYVYVSLYVCVMWIREGRRDKKETQREREKDRQRKRERIRSFLLLLLLSLSMGTAGKVEERENITVGVALSTDWPSLCCSFFDLLFFFTLLSLLHAYLLFLSLHHHTICLIVRKVENWEQIYDYLSLCFKFYSTYNDIEYNSIFGDDFYIIITNGNSRSPTKAEAWTWLSIVCNGSSSH